MVISPSFDFMEIFCQLCLVKSEKNSKKRQEIWLYFVWNNQNKAKTKLFISPWKARNLALGLIKCRLGYLGAIRIHFEAKIGFLGPSLGRKRQLLPRNIGSSYCFRAKVRSRLFKVTVTLATQAECVSLFCHTYCLPICSHPPSRAPLFLRKQEAKQAALILM